MSYQAKLHKCKSTFRKVIDRNNEPYGLSVGSTRCRAFIRPMVSRFEIVDAKRFGFRTILDWPLAPTGGSCLCCSLGGPGAWCFLRELSGRGFSTEFLSRPKPHSSTGCVAELAPGVAVCRRSGCRRRLMMGAGLACHGWRRGGLPSAFAGRGHIAVQDAHGASRSLGGRIPRAEFTSAPEKPRTECGQPLRTNSPSLRQVHVTCPASGTLS